MAKAKKIVTISDVTKLGDSLARTIRANYKWSKKLRNAVRLHKGKDDGGNVSIAITVGEGDDDLQGMARAFEYGSGEKGKFGQKYLIEAKNYPTLQFIGTNDFAGQIIRKKRVWHPGVAAKGTIQKSIESVRGRMSEDLRASIRKNIIDNIKVTVREINK